MKFSHQLSSSENDKENNMQSGHLNSTNQDTEVKGLSLDGYDPNLMFRKRQWTEKEDSTLIKVIKQYGAKRWAFIAQFIPNRVGKQCRERWHNHLNPNINKAQWTPYEEWLLYLLYLLYGGKWAKMTKALTQRTDNSIKNHWNSIMRKKVPFLKEKLQKILSDKQFDHGQTSSEEKYFIDKIRLRKYDQENKCIVDDEDNKSDNFSYFDEGANLQEPSSDIKQPSLQIMRRTSQFQVNIDGILPETTEDLSLKQVKLNKPQTKYFVPFMQVSSIIDEMNKQEQLVFPFMTKSQSIGQNFPALIFQKNQSSDFDIYGTNIKKKSSSSFADKNQFCKSPKIKARYSQIYASESESVKDDNEEPKQQKEILECISQEGTELQIRLKRRLSKNISIISPTKFMEKENLF